jgi:hypothetical protein
MPGLNGTSGPPVSFTFLATFFQYNRVQEDDRGKLVK